MPWTIPRRCLCQICPSLKQARLQRLWQGGEGDLQEGTSAPEKLFKSKFRFFFPLPSVFSHMSCYVSVKESEVVLELREHLAQAQKEAEILRSGRQMQAKLVKRGQNRGVLGGKLRVMSCIPTVNSFFEEIHWGWIGDHSFQFWSAPFSLS